MSEIVAQTILMNPRPIMGEDVVESTNAAIQRNETFNPAEILIQVIQRPTDPLNAKLQEAIYSWVAAGMAYQPVKDLFGGWIDVARNWQTKLFKKAEGHKYLLMIDSDVGPPVEAPLFLRRHDLPVVSGVVCGLSRSRGGLFVCVAVDGKDGTSRFITHKHHKSLPPRGLLEISRAGAGCLMVRRDVIETLWDKHEADLRDQEVAVCTIGNLLEDDVAGVHEKLTPEQRRATHAFLKRFHYKTDLFGAPFNIPQSVRDRAAELGAMPLGEDIMFTNRVRAAGFKMYVDLECRCTHDKVLTLEWPVDAIDENLSVEDFETSILDTPVEVT
jgi:hypothetical protein